MRCCAFFLVTERVLFFLRRSPSSQGLGRCFATPVTAGSPGDVCSTEKRPRGRGSVGRGLRTSGSVLHAHTNKRMPATASDAHHNKMCKKLQGRAASQRAARQGKTQGSVLALRVPVLHNASSSHHAESCERLARATSPHSLRLLVQISPFFFFFFK